MEWRAAIFLDRQPRRKVIYCGFGCLDAHDEQDGVDKRRNGITVSRRSTTVITANGSTDNSEEPTVHMKDLDMFVTVQLLEDTPALLSLAKPAKKMGLHTSGKKVKNQFLMNDDKHILCNCDYFVPAVVPGLSSDTDISGLAGDSAEDAKELSPSGRVVTQASSD